MSGDTLLAQNAGACEIRKMLEHTAELTGK